MEFSSISSPEMMNLVVWIGAYTVIALLVTGYTFVTGNLRRPTPKLFTTEDQVVLVLATVLVGSVWILFVPVLLGRGIVRFYRYASTKEIHFTLRRPRELRPRG